MTEKSKYSSKEKTTQYYYIVPIWDENDEMWDVFIDENKVGYIFPNFLKIPKIFSIIIYIALVYYPNPIFRVEGFTVFVQKIAIICIIPLDPDCIPFGICDYRFITPFWMSMGEVERLSDVFNFKARICIKKCKAVEILNPRKVVATDYYTAMVVTKLREQLVEEIQHIE